MGQPDIVLERTAGGCAAGVIGAAEGPPRADRAVGRPLNVFLTVDTEVWPKTRDWREKGLGADLARDVYGATGHGEFGITYQMDVLHRHGLKGVFFLESLFVEAAGRGPLERIVGEVRGRGQEVQLHLHTEWLGWMPRPLLGERRGRNLKDFSEDEQLALIGRALENLEACGGTGVTAFRAGNYGGDNRTLRAVRRLGLKCDTTYNPCYLGWTCDIRFPDRTPHPRMVDGVYEFPVTVFRDYPGHARHLQLTACSFHEIRHVLTEAWRSGWHSIVLVSHSVELLRGRKNLKPSRPVRPDPIVVRRFERLCAFLDENRDKFRTVGFSDVDLSEIPTAAAAVAQPPAIRSSVNRTAVRMFQQLVRRLT